jgi:hypothetical protein
MAVSFLLPPDYRDSAGRGTAQRTPRDIAAIGSDRASNGVDRQAPDERKEKKFIFDTLCETALVEFY